MKRILRVVIIILGAILIAKLLQGVLGPESGMGLAAGFAAGVYEALIVKD